MNLSSPPRLDVAALRRIDVACDRFEEAWRLGKNPQVEDYLDIAGDQERTWLLRQLQQVRQELLEHSHGDSPARAGKGEVSSEVIPPSTPTRCSQENHDAESPPLPQVLIKIIAGPHHGLELIYTEHNTLLAGRSKQAHLRLKEDLRVSRHHLRLEIKPPQCFLIDLQSSNGTLVNGERVTERFLQDGDVVSIGRTKLAIHLLDEIENPRKESVPSISRPSRGKSPRPSKGPDGSSRIPGYELHEQIGAGLLGTVFQATQRASGKTCAIKILNTETGLSERVIATFLREVEILRHLCHPNIVRLIESGRSGNELFLATEYLPTTNWPILTADWPTRKVIQTASKLMVQILNALETAHQQGFVHRDVKPENILIVQQGPELRAKLADFGLAKNYTNAGMSQMTRSGDVLGSLAYISPEQFINSRDAKPSSDLYSAAATFYWMLTGFPPVPVDSAKCRFLAILEEPPVPLQAHDMDAPPALCDWMRRALEKDPVNRFSSVGEMKDHLLRAIAQDR